MPEIRRRQLLLSPHPHAIVMAYNTLDTQNAPSHRYHKESMEMYDFIEYLSPFIEKHQITAESAQAPAADEQARPFPTGNKPPATEFASRFRYKTAVCIVLAVLFAVFIPLCQAQFPVPRTIVGTDVLRPMLITNPPMRGWTWQRPGEKFFCFTDNAILPVSLECPHGIYPC